MKRVKQAILAIFILGAALLLAMPSKSHHEIPPGRVVIRYWEKWTGIEAEQMQPIIDDFNNTVGKDKNIWVQFVSVSLVDQKTLAAAAAGDPPDVAGLWDDELAQYAAMGALEPLDDLAKAHGLTRDYYKPVFYDECKYNGKLYALPSTAAVIALLWNKKVFAEHADQLRAAGLDPTRAPKTIDELNRYSHALSVWKDGRLISTGYLPQEPGWYIMETPFWFGGSPVDEAHQKLTFTSKPCIDAFQWVRSFTERLSLKSIQDFRSSLPDKDSFATAQNPFLTGALAMEQQGPWMASYIQRLAPQLNHTKVSAEQEKSMTHEQRKDNYDWGVVPFPSAVPGFDNVGFAKTDIFTIPRGSKHKAEAFEFIAFVNRQDQMEKICLAHCVDSPLAKVSKEFIETHANPYIDVLENLAFSPNTRALPSIPIWPEISAELQFAADQVYELKATPEQAMKTAQDRMQVRLDRFNFIQNARQGTADERR